MSSMFVFPGQGSQFVGMGEDVLDKFPEIVQQADQVMGYSMRALCLEGPEEQLNQTQYTQPALYTVSVLHYLDALAEGASPPDFLAGHSLGEYAALYAAGVFDFETGLRIVKRRGELMSQAPKGAMAAVLDLDGETVARLVAESSFEHIDLANINTGTQIVVSGDYDEIFAAEPLFTEAGGRYRPLNVSGGLHSYLMKPIAQQFAEFLQDFTFSPPQRPVIANLTARPYPPNSFVHLLRDQIDHPVKWHETVSWALQEGVEQIDEIGPGMVLTKMSFAIKDKPLAVDPHDDGPVLEPDKPLAKDLKRIFMFAGQGSQYKNMGRELYATDASFKEHFDRCDQLVFERTGISLVAQLYHPHSPALMDDVRITHPAIFCFEYALAQTLIDRGVTPDGVVGTSLGEYVAAVVAGSLKVTDAIELVLEQAALLTAGTQPGRMLVVLGASDLFTERPELFEGVHLGGISYEGNFVVSGETQAVGECARRLEEASISHQELPVGIAFHSPVMEAVKGQFLEFAGRYKFKRAKVAVYTSCAKPGEHLASPEHLWNAVAEPMNFIDAVAPLHDGSAIFVDFSPSGSLQVNLKHGFEEQPPSAALLSQFGKDRSSLRAALQMLGQAA